MHLKNSMAPLLSITIPHYDVPDRLACMLESIEKQSIKDIEIIVVDDCSPRPCASVVEAFRGKGLPVRMVACSQRVHTMQARLLGLVEARGEIIYFVDADDRLWGTTTLEEHVKQFRESSADVLHFSAVLTDSDGIFKEYAHLTLPFGPLLIDSAIFEKYLNSNICGASCLWNKLFSRSLAMSIHDVAKKSAVVKHVEDGYIVAHLLFHASRYIGSEQIGYGYWYEDKMSEHAYERALYSYYILQEIPAYLLKHGCPSASVARYELNVRKYLAQCAGKMCINIVNRHGDFIPDTEIHELVRCAPAETIVKMLLLANQLNAKKIVNTVRVLFPDD